MKRFFIFLMLPLLCAACGGDNGGDTPQPPPGPGTTPSLLLSRENPIRFSAAATESYVVTVTSDLAWTASSDKTWCKVTPAAGKFTVTAAANTTDREPEEATVSVTVDGKTCATLTVTQEAELTEYPATVEALKAAVEKTWVFDEKSGFPYESLTLGKEVFVLMPRVKEVRSEAPEHPVITGTWAVSSDLRTLTLRDRELSEVCRITFSELHAGSALVSAEIPNESQFDHIGITSSPATGDRTPRRRLTRIQADIPDGGNVEYRFTWQGGRLTKIEAESDMETATCRIGYSSGKLTATIAEHLRNDDGSSYEQAVEAVYTLDAQGRAIRIALTDTKNKSFLGSVHLAYRPDGRLGCYEITDEEGSFEGMCQAEWFDGNLVREYVKENFDWDEDGDGLPDYDFNGDGVINMEDRMLYTWYNTEYGYSATENVAELILPFEVPELFNFDDAMGFGFGYIGYLAGVMGPGTKHLLSRADAQFRYTFDEEGYPAKCSVIDGSDSFECTFEFAWPE